MMCVELYNYMVRIYIIYEYSFICSVYSLEACSAHLLGLGAKRCFRWPWGATCRPAVRRQGLSGVKRLSWTWSWPLAVRLGLKEGSKP